MNANPVENVKQLCRALDVRQRKEVRDYIALLDKEQKQAVTSSTRASQVLTRDEEMWFASLQHHLAEITGSPTVERKLQAATLGSIQEGFACVHAFVQATGMGKSASYDRKALYNLLAGFVVEHAQHLAARISIPLTLKFVLQNVENVPALFDRAYPGYVRAGLACMVLDKVINPPPLED